MKHLKLQTAIIVCIALFYSIGTCDECNLRIGWESWGVYQFQKEEQLQGLDVELLNAIAKADACTLSWKELPWKRHLYELEHGRMDLACGASKNPEREKYAYFSDPYRTESVALYVRKGEYDKYPFQKIEDILKSSFALGITLGYDYGESFSQIMKNPDFDRHVQQVNSDTVNYKKLVKSRIDGFLGDPFATTEGLRKAGFLDQVEKHPMYVYSTDIHIMFSKKSTTPDKVDAFNKAISEIKQNGTYDKIMLKYLE